MERPPKKKKKKKKKKKEEVTNKRTQLQNNPSQVTQRRRALPSLIEISGHVNLGHEEMHLWDIFER